MRCSSTKTMGYRSVKGCLNLEVEIILNYLFFDLGTFDHRKENKKLYVNNFLRKQNFY